MLPLALLAFTTAISASPLASNAASDDTPLPVVLWHGLGDNYAADGINDVAALIEETYPGTFVYPVRLADDPSSDRSASFLGNTTEQIEKVCADIAAHPILSTAPAIDALGFSQGGLFLRAYVERCNTPPVRSLVTFGSPHNGIADYAPCGTTDWLCKGAMALLHTNTWSSFVQSRLVPAQYYRSVDPETGLPSDSYLEFSNLLADINNERALKNKAYAKNIATMEHFVLYEFANDTTVLPKESEWFAEVNVTSSEITPLKKRALYKEDWLGLRELDEKGGLIFKTAPGGHMQLGEEVLVDAFKTYFGPSNGGKKESETAEFVLEVGSLEL
jgi:palmitoyl-protein thioesterase